jgi:fructokinase
MQQAHLFPRLQQTVRQLLNDYIHLSALQEDLATYIVPPVLGDQAGVLGALVLAQQAFTESVS